MFDCVRLGSIEVVRRPKTRGGNWRQLIFAVRSRKFSPTKITRYPGCMGYLRLRPLTQDNEKQFITWNGTTTLLSRFVNYAVNLSPLFVSSRYQYFVCSRKGYFNKDVALNFMQFILNKSQRLLRQAVQISGGIQVDEFQIFRLSAINYTLALSISSENRTLSNSFPRAHLHGSIVFG